MVDPDAARPVATIVAGQLAFIGFSRLLALASRRRVAAIPTGGIGATINVVSRKPLDSRQSGLTGSIGAKADYDVSSKDCVHCGSHVTPEVSGVLSWSARSRLRPSPRYAGDASILDTAASTLFDFHLKL